MTDDKIIEIQDTISELKKLYKEADVVTELISLIYVTINQMEEMLDEIDV